MDAAQARTLAVNGLVGDNVDMNLVADMKGADQKRGFKQKMMVRSVLLAAALGGGMLQSAEASMPVDFSDVVAQVAPAVVRVTVSKKLSQEEQMQQQLPEMLKKFFGNQIQIPNQPRVPTEQKSYGSAFFISQDGYLLTNRHVVDDAKKVTITLNDRRELDADVVGSDERTDVAVLKVKGDHFPALKTGNSDILRVGEPVLAIGSPFGFDYSASAGIVSATSRSMTVDSAVPFIQSDVALNPGNSGGPLFNQRGEVIGINSRIFTGTGGYMGLSFSIPIDVAMDIADQLKRGGKIARSYLGVYPQDIDRNLAEVYHLPKPEGALVTKVSPNSAASIAGIKEGDIILSFDNQPISRASDLINRINRTRPGTSVVIGIQRDGSPMNITTKLKPASESDNTTSDVVSAVSSGQALGLKLREMTDKEKADQTTKGVVVGEVIPDGLADRAGLQPSDLIVRLNNIPTPTLASFVAVQKALPKQGVVGVLVVRNGSPMMVGLRLQ